MYAVPPVFTGAPSTGLGAFDFSSLSTQDYILIGAGLMALFAIWKPNAGIFGGGPKRKRRKVSGGTGFVGGLVTAAAVAGGGYFAYKYFFPEVAP